MRAVPRPGGAAPKAVKISAMSVPWRALARFLAVLALPLVGLAATPEAAVAQHTIRLPRLGILYPSAADVTLAQFVDRILRGATPAQLPVEQPARFELVVNVVAAKGLGLTLPASLLVQADEVLR